MRAHPHALIAVACVTPIALGTGDLVQGSAVLAAGVAAGLLPDLDHPYSLASKVLWPVSLFWWPVDDGMWRHGRRLLGHVTWHRHGFHSLVTGGILATLLLFAGAGVEGLGAFLLALSFGVGWISHDLADMATESGVMLFWPWKRQVKLPRWLAVKERSIFGHAVEGIASFLAVAVIAAEVSLR